MERSKLVATPLVVNEKFSKNDGDDMIEASLYRSLIGSLLNLVANKPHIMFSTSLLPRFM